THPNTLGFTIQYYQKIKKFKEFERESQQRIVKPRIKYATGVTLGRSRVVTFSQFLPIL
ncbi:1236_t:CDS:2, partial [Funneliformis mosseae]